MTMISEDISTSLTHQLSAILEDCRRIEPSLQAYLKANDERPHIARGGAGERPRLAPADDLPPFRRIETESYDRVRGDLLRQAGNQTKQRGAQAEKAVGYLQKRAL